MCQQPLHCDIEIGYLQCEPDLPANSAADLNLIVRLSLLFVGWRHQGSIPPVMASVSTVGCFATAIRDFVAGSC